MLLYWFYLVGVVLYVQEGGVGFRMEDCEDGRVEWVKGEKLPYLSFGKMRNIGVSYMG